MQSRPPLPPASPRRRLDRRCRLTAPSPLPSPRSVCAGTQGAGAHLAYLSSGPSEALLRLHLPLPRSPKRKLRLLPSQHVGQARRPKVTDEASGVSGGCRALPPALQRTAATAAAAVCRLLPNRADPLARVRGLSRAYRVIKVQLVLVYCVCECRV